MHFKLLSYSLPATLLFSLAACGDGGGEPASFSSATELQRERAIIAASGMDAAMGYLIASFATAAPPGSTCPSVVQSGSTFTMTYGCSTEDGHRIDGRVIATNLPSLFGGGESDPSKDASAVFEGYYQHGDTAADDLAFDGSITLHPDSGMVVALTAQLKGLSAYTDATYRGAGDLSTAAEGSTVELDGVGRATIAGSWNTSSDTPAGALELRGADVMRAEFGDMADGCVPITIDGHAAGALCQQAE